MSHWISDLYREENPEFQNSLGNDPQIAAFISWVHDSIPELCAGHENDVPVVIRPSGLPVSTLFDNFDETGGRTFPELGEEASRRGLDLVLIEAIGQTQKLQIIKKTSLADNS